MLFHHGFYPNLVRAALAGNAVTMAGSLLTRFSHKASLFFPITAKPDLMEALLPADNIIQVIAPAQDGRSGGSSNEEVGLHGNGGRAHSQAPWTVRRIRHLLCRTHKK